MPTLPVFRENKLGGLSQKFQFKYRKGAISLNRVRFSIVVACVFVFVVVGELLDDPLTVENTMLIHNKHIPMLMTSLIFLEKFLGMINPPHSTDL